MREQAVEVEVAYCGGCGAVMEAVRPGKFQHIGPCHADIKSVHVHLIPWCMCCVAEVPVDHVCACETNEANGGEVNAEK